MDEEIFDKNKPGDVYNDIDPRGLQETLAPPSTPTSDFDAEEYLESDGMRALIVDSIDDEMLEDPTGGNGDPNLVNIDRWCSVLERDCRGRIQVPEDVLNLNDRLTKNMVKFHLFLKGYFLLKSEMIGQIALNDYYANMSAVMMVAYVFPVDVVQKHQGFVKRSLFFRSVRKCLVPIMSRYSCIFRNALQMISRNPRATVFIVSQFFDKYLVRRNSITLSMHREALSCLIWGVIVLCVGNTASPEFYRRIESELILNTPKMFISRGSKQKLVDILAGFRERLGKLSMRNIDSMIRVIRRTFGERVISSPLFIQTIHFHRYPEIDELQFILRAISIEHRELRWSALFRFFPEEDKAFQQALLEMDDRFHISLASAQLSPVISHRKYFQIYLVARYVTLMQKYVTEKLEQNVLEISLDSELVQTMEQLNPKAKLLADEYLKTDEIALARLGIRRNPNQSRMEPTVIQTKNAYRFPQFLDITKAHLEFDFDI